MLRRTAALFALRSRFEAVAAARNRKSAIADLRTSKVRCGGSTRDRCRPFLRDARTRGGAVWDAPVHARSSIREGEEGATCRSARDLAIALTASASIQGKPCCDLASQGSLRRARRGAALRPLCTRPSVSRLLGFGASAAGVMAQPSRRCDAISDGNGDLLQRHARDAVRMAARNLHSGLARVIVDDSTTP